MSNFQFIRVFILLIILAIVWKHFDSQKKIIQNWDGTQDVVIIPINVDSEDKTQAAINALSKEQFADINDFFSNQAKRYGKSLENSIQITLASPISSMPPKLPNISSSEFDILIWSLKLRWWSFKNKPQNYHVGQVRLYVMYSTPKEKELLPHSTGLQKGLIGLIHASSHRKDKKRNNMIITHELLHIFGATDKYNLFSGHPIFPEGFAQPNKKNRFPQNKAEIMAGRIPISQSTFGRVYGLSQTVIGEKTAQEIGWIRNSN